MRRWTVLLSFLLVLVVCSAVMACPMCKDTVANDPAAGGSVPSGFNTSIYVMLGGMMAVLTIIGTVLFKAIRGG